MNELFQSSVKFANQAQAFDINVKKFVYRIISDMSKQERTSRVSINSVWQKFFNLPDEQQKNPMTNRSYLNSKEELKRVMEQLEADDLTMLDGEDVILIGE